MLPVIASKPFVVQGALPDVLMQMCLEGFAHGLTATQIPPVVPVQGSQKLQTHVVQSCSLETVQKQPFFCI